VEATMSPSDDDRLVPFGEMRLFTGMWSVVALVIIATAICI
jgi:hypothetical protein